MPTIGEAWEEFARTYLAQLLQIARADMNRAAKLASRSRTDLSELLGRHEFQPDEFKQH